MLKKRIIAVLLFDSNGQVVKPHKFGAPIRKCGPLIQHVKVMNERGIDELIILDIEARKNNKPPNFDVISHAAANCFAPLSVGGGIKTLEDCTKLISQCGADKLVFHNADEKLLFKVNAKFGAQAIVEAINYYGPAKIKFPSSFAGEAMLTSMDRENTNLGYDLIKLESFCRNSHVPVIANGGCGHPCDMLKAIKMGADAVAAGSLFLFTDWTPKKCAEYLISHNIEVRLDE